MSTRTDAIVDGCASGCTQAGARGFVFGLSGGIDSAVVARLCQTAAPANVVGVLMPCHSDPQDDADARLVADHFSDAHSSAWTSRPTFDVFTADRAARRPPRCPQEQLAGTVRAARGSRRALPLANVKPRLRMTTLITWRIR